MIHPLSIATEGYLSDGKNATLAISVAGYLFDYDEVEEIVSKPRVGSQMAGGAGGHSYRAEKVTTPKKSIKEIQKLKQLIREDEELLIFLQGFVVAYK